SRPGSSPTRGAAGNVKLSPCVTGATDPGRGEQRIQSFSPSPGPVPAPRPLRNRSATAPAARTRTTAIRIQTHAGIPLPVESAAAGAGLGAAELELAATLELAGVPDSAAEEVGAAAEPVGAV